MPTSEAESRWLCTMRDSNSLRDSIIFSDSSFTDCILSWSIVKATKQFKPRTAAAISTGFCALRVLVFRILYATWLTNSSLDSMNLSKLLLTWWYQPPAKSETLKSLLASDNISNPLLKDSDSCRPIGVIFALFIITRRLVDVLFTNSLIESLNRANWSMIAYRKTCCWQPNNAWEFPIFLKVLSSRISYSMSGYWEETIRHPDSTKLLIWLTKYFSTSSRRPKSSVGFSSAKTSP